MAVLPKEVQVEYVHKKFTQDFVLHVTISREYKIRSWFAERLIRLAARILGCGIKVVE